nr:ribonuclease III domain-containing protein [Brachybacterium sp. Z12]
MRRRTRRPDGAQAPRHRGRRPAGSARPSSLDGAQAADLKASGLLELALTHRSYSYENDGLPHNERLEFLGDAVLQLAVTEHLYASHPTLPEGDLARRRAATVSTRALAVIASSSTSAPTCGWAAARTSPAVVRRPRSSLTPPRP